MTVEELARLIAMRHGSAMTSRREGNMQTVASDHGFGQWGHSPEYYANAHWGRYQGAAQAVLEHFSPKPWWQQSN